MDYGILKLILSNFLKEINYEYEGITESKVVKQIRKIIRQSYTFFGYTIFKLFKICNGPICYTR